MSRSGLSRLAACALLGVWGSGCAGHRAAELRDRGERLAFGIYRGVLETDGGTEVRFRLLLYAAPPDALHAEVLGPVGGALWIVDAGGGRLAVTDVAGKVAYAGPADSGAVERAIGVRATLPDLVAALLGGRALPGPLEMDRAPPGASGLPLIFEVREGRRVLRLERRRLRWTRPSGQVGTGAPPDGLPVEPVSNLPALEGPAFVRSLESEGAQAPF